jgi:hypothetical protein
MEAVASYVWSHCRVVGHPIGVLPGALREPGKGRSD